jgi:CRP/FNR family cyclic AMP-dependent transcriptional regulator
MTSSNHYQILRESALGSELEKEECEVLVKVLTASKLKQGDVLIREGARDDSLHVVISGRIAATRDTGNNDTVTLHVLHEGDIAGAMGFIDGKEHSATLLALSDTDIFSLQRQAFESLLDEYPHLVYKVMRTIIRSVHKTLLRMNRQFVEMNNYIMKEHGRY